MMLVSNHPSSLIFVVCDKLCCLHETRDGGISDMFDPQVLQELRERHEDLKIRVAELRRFL
jgi:hypothetical protein